MPEFAILDPSADAAQQLLLGQHCLFVTRDVFTDPPTPIAIVRVSSSSTTAVAPASRRAVPAGAVCVPESDVEHTAGWQQRHDRPHALTVCFMHSFGKCAGRGGDPATCQQIHLKRAVLDALRRAPCFAAHPPRQLLSRTVKAVIPEAVHAAISGPLRRRAPMQFFEFSSADVAPSAGFARYEDDFRSWLSGAGGAAAATTAEHAGGSSGGGCFTSPHTALCESYALRGYCGDKTLCSRIHARLSTAMTRDPQLTTVLAGLTQCCSLLQHGCGDDERAAVCLPQKLLWSLFAE